MPPKPYWTEHWESIIAPLARRPRLLIACGYDGTLAPLAPLPTEAHLSQQTHILLRRLSACEGVTLAVISGRRLNDLRARVGLEKICYAGNHGLEIHAPGIVWSSRAAANQRSELAEVILLLEQQTASFPGVLVEDKGLTATFHWRLVDPQLLPALHERVTSIVQLYPGLRLTPGKAVWEIQPAVGWNKASALLHFVSAQGLSPADAIFVGNDETDEAAFLALPDALTLRVGQQSPTAARLRLNDPDDTFSFLFCLFTARMGIRPRAALRG